MQQSHGVKKRRESAIKILEMQLQRGTKKVRIGGHETTEVVALDEKDRIKKKNEITNLKTKLKIN